MDQGRKWTLIISLAIFIVCSSGLAQGAARREIAVHIYNDAQVAPATLTRAEQEASRIFVDAGLGVAWANCPCMEGAVLASGRDQGNQPAVLVLHIIDHAAGETSKGDFGLAFLGAGGIGRYGDVFWERVRELQQNSDVNAAAVLGGVIAHEVGHLLLGSNAHAVGGIMLPRWQTAELHRIGMGTLLFLPEQAKKMRARLEMAGTL
jgi:hypothetical protein